jgi:putative ABC transport system permease protein
MNRYGHDIVIAIESILGNKLRSLLTALGIIFGVAAVISMLAIGKGAQQEILEQIKMVGVNNIMIIPIVENNSQASEDNSNGQNTEKSKFSPGLHLKDVEAIKEVLPTLKMISPEIALSSYVVQGGKRETAKLLGVSSEYFDIFNMNLEQGEVFSAMHEESGMPVCVIGANIARKFFSSENPLGKYIKFDRVWLRVIGVIERTNVELSRFDQAGVNVMNDNIYIPVKTMLLRFQNRELVSTRIQNVSSSSSFMSRFFGFSMSVVTTQNTESNYHQLDKIIVQVNDSEELTPATELLGRLLLRRHQEVKDFEITVPELLLKQEQRTKDVFNIVLGAIASISLVVGGIGIMNIMFASVMERIREIGTRLAIGAKKQDIVVQFLAEAVLISVSGGIIGVILGIVAARLINEFSGILTIISPFSVLIAFFVSASVGIIFGYSPAKRASEKDPIESLRYE